MESVGVNCAGFEETNSGKSPLSLPAANLRVDAALEKAHERHGPTHSLIKSDRKLRTRLQCLDVHTPCLHSAAN